MHSYLIKKLDRLNKKNVEELSNVVPKTKSYSSDQAIVKEASDQPPKKKATKRPPKPRCVAAPPSPPTSAVSITPVDSNLALNAPPTDLTAIPVQSSAAGSVMSSPRRDSHIPATEEEEVDKMEVDSNATDSDANEYV